MRRKTFMMSQIALSVSVFFCFTVPALAQDIAARFSDNHKISYRVYANAVPSGSIQWQYLGRQEIDGRIVDVVAVSSDTKILKFLNLTSSEKVFLDSLTHLPRRVERDVIMFGKKELIQEEYDQASGQVIIRRRKSSDEPAGDDEVLERKPPVHNILDLLYFFPSDIPLEKNTWINFTLPTQKVKIKLIRETSFAFAGKNIPAYLLAGRGDKHFNLWLDKRDRTPLRLEFIFLLGKVSIVREPPEEES